MGNFVSAFSLYEVLRILIPGFYVTLMLEDLIPRVCLNSKLELEPFGYGILFVILSVLFGGFSYSLDVPRWFKKCYSSLPTNLIEKNKVIPVPEGVHKRYVDIEYFKFYYQHSSDAKYKTEIQSGFFHLFITMAFISAVSFLLYLLFCSMNPFLFWNSIVLFFSISSAILLYHRHLKYSWLRNYEEFLEYLKNKEKGSTL